jgi:hypothetical protein
MLSPVELRKYKLESQAGVEPAPQGFAVPRISHFATETKNSFWFFDYSFPNSAVKTRKTFSPYVATKASRFENYY